MWDQLPRSATEFWGLVGVLVLAAALRLTFLGLNIQEHPAFFAQPREEVFTQLRDPTELYINVFGFEVSNIACAWVCLGEGFASPFGGSTGPTGWIAPGLVVLYAASFSLFGCFTTASILALFGLALLLSLATCWLTFSSAHLSFGHRTTAFLAAVLFAVAPFDLWLFRVPSAMELNIYIFFFALLLNLALRYWHSPSFGRLAGLAGATGVAVLCYPGFGLCGLAAVLLRARVNRAAAVAVHLLVFAVLGAVLVAPYLVWQRRYLGAWVPVKFNGLFELYLGNRREVQGVLSESVFKLYHPSESPSEFHHYRTAGEFAYVQHKFEEFRRDFSFSSFIAATGTRLVAYFFAYTPKGWDTRPLRTAIKAVLWALPGVVLVIFPLLARHLLGPPVLLAYAFVATFALPFLLTGVTERYRLPLAAVVVILGAALVGRPRPSPTGERSRPGSSR